MDSLPSTSRLPEPDPDLVESYQTLQELHRPLADQKPRVRTPPPLRVRTSLWKTMRTNIRTNLKRKKSAVKSTSDINLAAVAWHGGRYEYTALEADACSHERLELERQARERAHSACQNYLKSCPRYTLIHHLNDIGSRVDKHWFVVRDASIKTERLLTLVPRSSACPIQCNASTRTTILELFLALQHPYIYPVLDLEFRDTSGQMYAILVLPFNDKGSLKDLIYKSRWQDDWGQKYGQRSAGLPISQVQRLGRQILEALLFLKERGFPPCAHLHSGNIILQNGVARLTGLENTLLGYTSRIHPVIWSRARSEPNSIDSICFGHVLFEMCAGYELCAPQPSPTHLMDVSDYQPVIEVLDLIFQHPEKRFPSVEELLFNDFFRNIDLREMRATPLPQAFQPRLTASTLGLLSEIKRFQISRRARRAQAAAAAAATAETSSPHRERRSNPRTASAVSRMVRLRCQVCPEANSFAEFERQWETQVVGAPWGQDDEIDSIIANCAAHDRRPSPTQEHRDLSLHILDDISPSSFLETRCLLGR